MTHSSFPYALADSIRADRLVLRAPRDNDAADIQRLANNGRIYEMLARLPHPYTMDDAHEFISKLARSSTEHAYAITREDALVGIIGLSHRTNDDGKSQLEIGYWLGEPYWGKGYATESAQALMNDVLARYPDAPLIGSAKTENVGSVNVLTKVGFAETHRFFTDCGPHKNVEITYFAYAGGHDGT